MHQIIEKPTGTSFELDPSKAGPNDDIEKNAEHLKLICQALLDLICSSLPRVPTYAFSLRSCISLRLADIQYVPRIVPLHLGSS